ncbi:unnamed protein product [Amoebophrya sp. A25]|nr:unnamed protein product [Amoebophrya sp. A25]|eukprot:GSA25T00009915001.1
MVLEDRGVPYAMKPRDVSREEYRNLTEGFSCTRNRVFNVGPQVGTFNLNADRASSSACKTLDPRGEYDASTHKIRYEPIPEGMAKNGWPKQVRGGRIMDHIEPSDTQRRKHGALDRNIAGDNTVQDQFNSYVGYDSSYYGGNVGSRNAMQYDASKMPSQK